MRNTTTSGIVLNNCPKVYPTYHLILELFMIHRISFLFFSLKAHNVIFFTLALMGGIFSASLFNTLIAAYVLIGLCFLITLIMFLCKKIDLRTYSFLATLAFFYITGAYLYTQHLEKQKYFFDSLPHTPLALKAKVQDVTLISHPRFTHILNLQVKEIQEHLPPLPCSILVYIKAKQTPEVDDIVNIKNAKLSPPANKDFAHYLLKEGFYAALFLDATNIEIVYRPRSSLRRWLVNKREALSASLQEKCSPATFTFISALFLGNKNRVKKSIDALKEYFQAWGVPHHLSHSGLHLLIFVFLCEFLLNFLPIAFVLKQLILIALVCTYGLLSWSTISFLRAVTTFLFYKICIFLQEPINGTYIIALICLLMLLFNPLQLFFLNFQLNFALTFALSWFNKVRSQQRHAFL